MPTPIYSAFTIVAVESIWPSANGDEIPINYLDLSYLGQRLGGFDASSFIEEKKAALEELIQQSEEEKIKSAESIPLARSYPYYSFEFQKGSEVNSDDISFFESELAYYRERLAFYEATLVSLEFARIGATGDELEELEANISYNENMKESSTFKIGQINGYIDILNDIVFVINKEGVLEKESLLQDFPSFSSARNSNQELVSLLKGYSEELIQEEEVNFDRVETTENLLGQDKASYLSLFSSIISDIESAEVAYENFISSYQSALAVVNNTISLDEEVKSLESQEYVTYPQSVYKPGFSSIFTSEDAIKRRRGYFKIIPLNVIAASTSVGTGGQVGESSFSVSFTLDDVILVADSYSSENIFASVMPRALPISMNTFTDELSKIFGEEIPETVSKEIAPYGSSIYRVSANDFPFNIEDLIEANDTVTVWMYHDPKEFDFIPKSSIDSFSNDFLYNKDFSYVIGTGSRKSQDDFALSENNIKGYSPPKTYVQAILNDSEILTDYLAPETLSSFSGDNPNELTEEDFSLEDSLDFLIASGKSANFLGHRDASSYVTNLERGSQENLSRLDRLAASIYGEYGQTLNVTSFKQAIDYLYLVDLEKYNQGISSRVNVLSEELGESERARTVSPNLVIFQDVSGALISSLREISIDESLTNTDQRYESWKQLPSVNQYIPSIANGVSLSSLYGEEEIKEIFDYLDSFRGTLSSLSNESLRFLSNQNQIDVSSSAGSIQASGFFNKRKIIVSKSHGETPYLAIKGHVDSTQTTYSSSSGGHTVSISGRGYDKILTDNEVYYEDLFSPTGGQFAQLTEGFPKYSQMLPPKAILSFLEANVPRFIVVGQPSAGFIDAKNAGLYLSTVDRDTSVQEESDEEIEDDKINLLESEEAKNILDKYFPDGSVLIRGLSVVNLNSAGDAQINEDGLPENQTFDPEGTSLRIFYPVNYLNTSRIQEMVNSLEKTYEKNPEDAIIRVPITIKSQESVAGNVLNFNGPKEINHMFVDETGRFRQRMAFEAWERTPQPEYTPIITDNDLLSSGASFSRDSSQVLTMVDVRPNFFGTASGIVNALFAGRTLSTANDYIPITTLTKNDIGENADDILYTDFYGAISEEFFRYGLRYQLINDIYTTSTNVAKRKSILYHGFFSKPIKSSSVSLRNNTSYRAGETVLVMLNKYKHRSKEVVDVLKTLSWLDYLKKNPDLIPLYIGVDTRWINNDSYYLTQGEGSLSNYSYWLNDPLFRENPHLFVLDRFIETLKFVDGKIPDNTYKIMTPEYFPTTWWAFDSYGDVISRRFSSSKNIDDVYGEIYSALVSKNFSGINIESPDVLNAIRLQNFKCTSYYIDSVSHEYLHGENFTTSLSLTHGQDNLVLLEPFSMRPIGFMSIEKRMRIGYDDIVLDQEQTPVYDNPDMNTYDRLLWEDFEGKKKSEIQNMYIEQFNQDKIFKDNSFLYQSQKNRNSANFMYEIALDLGLSD